ncbi:Uncharacterised protein [Mycobacteroides abscessus subsp. abscessus]|nr:Uncharacterised protein [Mycobacteroides abscessus subsp. abscessus]
MSSAMSTSPAMSASRARGAIGGAATVAINSPEARRVDGSAPSSWLDSNTGATATDSTTGPGTAHLPKPSRATTRSTGCAPMPSYFSDTARAVTPSSASVDHTARPGP